jgi:hypothetical protein
LSAGLGVFDPGVCPRVGSAKRTMESAPVLGDLLAVLFFTQA